MLFPLIAIAAAGGYLLLRKPKAPSGQSPQQVQVQDVVYTPVVPSAPAYVAPYVPPPPRPIGLDAPSWAPEAQQGVVTVVAGQDATITYGSQLIFDFPPGFQWNEQPRPDDPAMVEAIVIATPAGNDFGYSLPAIGDITFSGSLQYVENGTVSPFKSVIHVV